jgi:glycosyltransferase involved in cell wall biosynthesis
LTCTDFGQRPAASGLPANRILDVGSLNLSDEQHKRLPDLLVACKMLLAEQPALCLTVVGGGDGLPAYAQLAADLGIAEAVVFRGRLAGETLADAYREATVLAVPSLRETFGMVIVEAMASGLPVVAVGAGGIPDVLDNFNDGILVPPRDPAAIADALKVILNDPEKAAAMGAAGRRKVTETMGWPGQIAALDQVLNAAIHRRPAKRPAAS